MNGKQKSLPALLDWWVIAIYIVLVCMGWVTVCGASYDIDSGANFFDFSTRSGMQIVWIGTSLILGAIILCIDETLYHAFSVVFYIGFMLLLLVTPFVAHDIKGSLSWIKIGPFSIQPAEFAKFATALCLAYYIGRPAFDMSRTRDFLSACLITFLPMVLIVMQRETGSALVYLAFFIVLYREGMTGSIIFAGIAAITYFVLGVSYAGVPLCGVEQVDAGHFMVLSIIDLFTLAMLGVYNKDRLPCAQVLLFSAGAIVCSAVIAILLLPYNAVFIPLALCVSLIVFLLYLALSKRRWLYFAIAAFGMGSMAFHYSCDKVMNDVLEEHQQTRIRVLLGLEDDPRGAGYNVIQAKIAIGSGGLKGKGFLNGTQTKLKYVPEQDTDFIFCTVGEEEGFAGCAVVLSLFLALILRLIVLAERQSVVFNRVYGYSVASIFLFHLFINVGMVLGLTPVIGIPLPFFSYGGSSLWGFTLLLFIFLRMDASDKRLRHKKVQT